MVVTALIRRVIQGRRCSPGTSARARLHAARKPIGVSPHDAPSDAAPETIAVAGAVVQEDA
jgi:hypothetical protein